MTNMEGRYRGNRQRTGAKKTKGNGKTLTAGIEAGQTSSLPLRIERPMRGDEDQSTPGIPHTV